MFLFTFEFHLRTLDLLKIFVSALSITLIVVIVSQAQCDVEGWNSVISFHLFHLKEDAMKLRRR